jgi:hypothetical protein
MYPSDRSSNPVRCFSVFAAPEVSVTARVLGEFAKRGLLPSRFEAVVAGDDLAIDVQVDRLDEQAAAHVAEVLRGLIHVERVLMTTKTLAQEARA